MKPEDFHPDRFDHGGKYAFYLELGEPAGNVSLPVLLVRGSAPGKRLVVSAGVHGDEYEGVRTIFDIYAKADPAKMRGDLLCVSVANPPAFWNGTRESPLDGGNLARAFPGSLDAGVTAAIAHFMGPTIIQHADLYIDLHSGGISWLYPTMIGYSTADERSREAALAFGAPVMWGHPVTAPGRTISFAEEKGIPWLYSEAHGAGRIDPEDLKIFVRGVTNLLVLLDIEDGTIEKSKVAYHLFGGGDLDAGVSATRRGFVVSDAKLFQKVSQGELLGRLCNLLGETIEEYRAPQDGVLGVVRGFPIVKPEDTVFVVTGLADDEAGA
jgi:predicted deacylase